MRPLSSTVVASTSRPPASISVSSFTSPLRALAHQRPSNSRSTSSARLRAGSLRRSAGGGQQRRGDKGSHQRRSTRQATRCDAAAKAHQESGALSFHLMRYSTRMAFWPSSGTRRTPVIRSTSADCGVQASAQALARRSASGRRPHLRGRGHGAHGAHAPARLVRAWCARQRERAAGRLLRAQPRRAHATACSMQLHYYALQAPRTRGRKRLEQTAGRRQPNKRHAPRRKLSPELTPFATQVPACV